MSDNVRDANVRLTADVDPYRRELAAAHDETTKLASAIDKLGQSLDGITKRAGKKLVLFGAGGAAGIAGVTLEAANFQKKLETLNATAAITDKSFTGLTKNVTDLTKKFPIARDEAIALITQLDKLGITSTKSIGKISESMVKLSAATGENLTSLTDGMVQLGRQMGTLQAGSMDQFANSLLVVSKNAGVSASSVLQFAQAIAPAARAAGMGQQALLGVSTAFTKAGADGYAAASTFSTVLADITRQIASGSPDIAKYSNLIGVTAERFSKMDSAEALTRIFEAINAQGGDAIKTLDRLGFDGVRAMKSIQAVSQSGGLRRAIAEATGSYDNTTALDKGSAAAMDGLVDEMIKFKNAMQEVITSTGKPFLTWFERMASVATTVTKAVQPLVDLLSGVGSKLSGFASIAATVVGAGMMIGGPLSAMAIGSYVARSTPVRALRDGFEVGRDQVMGRDVDPEKATRANRWWNRPAFLLGQGTGQALGGAAEPGFANRVMGPLATSPIRLGAWLANMQGDFYRDARVPGFMRRDGLLSGTGHAFNAMLHPAAFRAGMGTTSPAAAATAAGAAPGSGAAAAAAFGAGLRNLTQSTITHNRAVTAQTAITRQLTMSTGDLVKALFRMQMQALGTGASTAGRIAMSTGKAVGRGVFDLMGGPWTAALLAGGLGVKMARDAVRDNNETLTLDDASPLAKYNAALGISTTELGTFARAIRDATSALPHAGTFSDVARVSGGVLRAASTPGRKMTDPMIGSLGSNPDILAAYAQMLGITDPRQLQQLQIDIADAHPGRTAQKATDAFLNLRLNKASTDYSALAKVSTRMHGRGGIGELWQMGPTDEANQMLSRQLMGIEEQRLANAAQFGNKYANQTALGEQLTFLAANMPNQKQATRSGSIFHGGINLEPNLRFWDTRGFLDSRKSTQNARSAVRLIEQNTFGGAELGFSNKQITDMESDLGKKMNNPVARLKWITNWIKQVDNPEVQKQIKAMERSGVEFGALTETQEMTLRKGEGWLNKKIRLTGPLGEQALSSATIQDAIDKPGDPNRGLRAINELMNKSMELGGGFAEATGSLQRLKDALNDATHPLHQMATAAQQFIATQRQYALGGMTRSQRAGDSVSTYLEARRANPDGKDFQANLTGSVEGILQTKDELRGYFTNLVAAYRNWGIQMERQEEDRQRMLFRSNRDFTQQMTYAEADYLTSRLRSNRDFGIAMAQQEDDFQLNMARSREDFNRQMARSQADFDRQMARQAEDAAKTIFDPFRRMPVEYTTGLDTMLQRLKDQNTRITNQLKNVQALKKAGLDQEAIDTLQLMDPSNARQVERMAADVKSGGSAILDEINKQVAKRQEATKKLVQDPMSEDYRRIMADRRRDVRQATSDFSRQMDRSTADFARSADRAREAHGRMLGDMADDFEKTTTRAKKAHNLALADMAEEYAIQVNRSKEDLVELSTQIVGDFETMWTRALHHITQKLGVMGKTVSDELKKLKEDYPHLFKSTEELMQVPDRNPPKSPKVGERNTPSPRDRADAATDRNPVVPDPSAVGKGGVAGTRTGVRMSWVRDAGTVASRTEYKGTTSYTNVTNFNGDIKVQADSPREMTKKLAEEARRKRLTRPVLSGPAV